MSRLDPTVKKETGYIALWVLGLSLVMEGVFLVLHAWDLSVAGGNLVGAAVAVGNYLLLGITVARAVSGPADRAALKLRSSMTVRFLGMGAVCALAVGLLHTNVYATLIPLLFPRVGIAFRPLADRARGGQRTEAEGSDLLD